MDLGQKNNLAHDTFFLTPVIRPMTKMLLLVPTKVWNIHCVSHLNFSTTSSSLYPSPPSWHPIPLLSFLTLSSSPSLRPFPPSPSLPNLHPTLFPHALGILFYYVIKRNHDFVYIFFGKIKNGIMTLLCILTKQNDYVTYFFGFGKP